MSANDYDSLFGDYPPYEEAPMRELYSKVARLIPGTAHVVDLGCGNGYLASALRERYYAGVYTGIDFSPVALEMAENALSEQATDDYAEPPQGEYYFDCVDLNDWTPVIDGYTHRTVFTCFEVLEHYDNDISLVDKIPARSRFIFSVPNYWSQTHVRTYDSVGVVFNRYAHALRFTAWSLVPTQEREAAIHLYDSYRRSDKW